MPNTISQRQTYAALLLSLISLFAAANDSRAQTVWSGFTKTFTKDDGDDGSLAAFQDKITANVRIARGFTGGLYNGVTEDFYNTPSPDDTEWATALIPENASKTIAATNWQALAFTNWTAAYQGHMHDGMLPGNLLGNNAVVHLITDNIYLDLEFNSWSSFGAGGFSYTRAEAPVAPITTGDYNHNHIVDAADYTVWRDHLGQSVSPNGSGADGNANGIIDAGDYNFWKMNFGNLAPGAGSGAGAVATVPEPSAAFLTLVLLTSLGGETMLRRINARWMP